MLKKTTDSAKPLTYEDCYEEINEIIKWNRGKWRLTSISYMDFDDVAQKIRFHIYTKWDSWDQSRPLKPWVSRIVSRQIINQIRNNHTIYARPCVTCRWNQGGNSCELYGEQSSDCAEFKKWENGKKIAYEIHHASSIQGSDRALNSDKNESNHVSGSVNDFHQIEDKNSYMDIEGAAEELHAKMEKKLSKIQWMVYKYLYIEHKSEEETAKLMGYYSCEKKRSPGYKQIKNIKKQIFKIAKELLNE